MAARSAAREERQRSRPGRRLRRGDHFAGWGFVSPAVLLIGVFGLVPVVWSLVLSFQETDLTSPGTWSGTSNYQRMVHDPVFWQAARQTLVYCVLFVPITMGVAVPIAVLLNQKVRGMTFYRMAVFAPLVTFTLPTGRIVRWLLNPHFVP